MSAVRYSIWQSKMGNKKSAPDLKSLPPTSDAFEEHVHRAHYQAAVWRASMYAEPPTLDPSQYGWSRENVTNVLIPVPLSLDVSPAPLDVLKMIRCGCTSARPCSTNRCSCSAAKLSCSMFCGCRGADDCCNEQTRLASANDTDKTTEH